MNQVYELFEQFSVYVFFFRFGWNSISMYIILDYIVVIFFSAVWFLYTWAFCLSLYFELFSFIHMQNFVAIWIGLTKKGTILLFDSFSFFFVIERKKYMA